MKSLLVLLSISLLAPLNAQDACDTSDLLGKWASKSEKRTYVEHWQKVSDDTYEGYSEVLDSDNQRLGYESLRLVKMSGEVFYLAKVSQNAMPTPFKLVQCEKGAFKFENPEHDFPKSLTYIRAGDDSLTVEVRGEDNNGFDLRFKRQE